MPWGWSRLLLGCESDVNDDPAEKAGETMDKAGDNVQDKMEEAGDKIKNATD